MKAIKYILFVIIANFLAPAAFSAGVAYPALQFLVGNWVAESKPGEATAHFEFALDLQGKVLVRHNHLEYPASGAVPAGVHDDLFVIYQDGVPLATHGVYFDSEGYSARYTATTKGAGEVVFVSDAIPKLARYRLTYTALPDGRLNAKLEVAPAGKPNGFVPYLEWVSKKVAAGPAETKP